MPITKERHLSELIEGGLKELELPEMPALLYDPIRYTLDLPGKRVRPYLTLIGCGLAGGDIKEALPAALAMELLHNFTLLHDDIMDQADTRRGKASVFKRWDSNTAILSGDAMYARAFKQLQHYGRSEQYSKKQYSRILDIFLGSAEKVCEGQAFDLEFEEQSQVTIADYLHMIEGKTAALISGSLAIGAAVAAANEDSIQQLQSVGRKTGIAFQIQDDLLDVVADPEKFGKERGGDIREGKKTYLSLLALQRCNSHQKELLSKELSSSRRSPDGVAAVIELYKELNVIDAADKIVQQYYEEAMEEVAVFDPSPYKDKIITFLNRLLSRES
ncbi:MAG TPA: polyprenyl synthetase family protein [Fodinibius sp.]|nr:polyprenyl synthetase family protein [Fodinibius sp.]